MSVVETFVTAAWADDVSAISKMLADEHVLVDVNAADDNDLTVLQLAARAGSVAACALLLADARTDVNRSRATTEETPLFLACKHGRFTVAQLLIDAGAGVNQLRRDGDSPLHAAVAGGHERVVSLLIASCANLEWKDRNEQTPLHLCAGIGGPPPRQRRGKLLAAAATAAAREAALTTAGLLIDAGANVSACDAKGQSPLQLCAATNNVQVARRLLAASADVDDAGIERYCTPLGQAARHEHAEMMAVLIEAGVDLNLCDWTGHTPLWMSAEWQNATLYARRRPRSGIRPRTPLP